MAIGGNLIVGGDNTDRTYAGLLSGAGAFTKTGNGKLTLSNANSSFTGAFILDKGTVSVASFSNNGIASPIGSGDTITIRSGTTVEYTGNGGQNMNRSITLDGSAGGSIVADIPVGNAGLTLSGVAGEVNGPAVLRVRNTNIGFLRLSGANSFTGGINFEEGNVLVNGVANSGTNSPFGRSGTITLGSNGTTDGGFFYEGAANDSTNRPIKIDLLGTIGVNTAGTVLTLSGVISNDDTRSGTPQLTKAGPGTLVLGAVESYDNSQLVATPGPASNTIILDGTLRMAANTDLPHPHACRRPARARPSTPTPPAK